MLCTTVVCCLSTGYSTLMFFFFFQAEDGIRDIGVTGVQTCALPISNKTAVVIGGTSGIGLALTRGLAQAGANVVPTGRRAEQVRDAAAQVVALGKRSLSQTCDVTDNASIERLLQAVCAEFGSVQILVNCAGRTKKMPTLDFPEADWDAILETNLKGTLRACRVLGRH